VNIIDQNRFLSVAYVWRKIKKNITILNTMIKEEKIPKLWKEAKEKGLKFYFTGKPCKHGHLSKRSVSDAHCLQCEIEIWYPRNRAKPERKKYMKEYRLKYKDTFLYPTILRFVFPTLF